MASLGPKVILLSCGCYWDTERPLDLGQIYTCPTADHGIQPIVQMTTRAWFWRYANDGS